MTGTSNNVWGRSSNGHYRRVWTTEEFPAFSRILQEEGKSRLEEYLAIDALDGNIKFQSGKYREFAQWYWLRIDTDQELREKTSWLHHDYGPSDSESEKLWREKRKELLVKAWHEFQKREREPRKKYQVRVNTHGNIFFVSDITPNKIWVVSDQREAKIFNMTYSGLFQRVKCLGGENISIEEVV
jgi:hypothetical protein